ncbi:MAG: O-antigen ligase family protein [Sphingomonas sp.]
MPDPQASDLVANRGQFKHAKPGRRWVDFAIRQALATASSADPNMIAAHQMISDFFKSNRPGVLYASLILLSVAVLLGGASRTDVLSPLVVRLAAIVAIMWLVWTRPLGQLELRWMHWLLLCGTVALPLLQLIPLPFDTWSALPGRQIPKSLFDILGEHPAQPISIAPGRTLNSALALLPAIAAFLLGRLLDVDGRNSLLTLALSLCLFSAALGLLQVAAGSGSVLYFYAITNRDAGVGLFSNANHQSLFLAIGIVLVFAWIARLVEQRRAIPRGPAIGALLMLALLYFSIISTDSRAGAIMSVVAFFGGFALLPLQRIGVPRWLIGAAVGLPLVAMVAGVTMLLTGAVLKDRFLVTHVEESRIDRLPIFRRMISDQFPAGSGLGTFDPLYRSYETPDTLTFAYLNAAHNDYAQLAIEGGAAAIALLAIFIIWWLSRFATIWRGAAGNREVYRDIQRQGRIATLVTLFALAHSAADYPLRTAAILTLFAFMCAMLEAPASGVRSQRQRVARSPAAVP